MDDASRTSVKIMKPPLLPGAASESTINTYHHRVVVPTALLKLNPLAAWSYDRVWRYIREHGVPHNALHDEGYPSIGCQPCTRAVGPGEHERDGRWWWEHDGVKECGLHVAGDGI